MGAYDDIPLLPGSVATTGGGGYGDIPVKTEDELRRKKLRDMARAAMGEAGAGDLFGNAFTLGLQKPVSGLAQMAGGEVGEWFGGEPATLGERWGAGTGAYQDFMDEARRNSGWAGTGAELAGGVLAGGPARELATQAFTSLPRQMRAKRHARRHRGRGGERRGPWQRSYGGSGRSRLLRRDDRHPRRPAGVRQAVYRRRAGRPDDPARDRQRPRSGCDPGAVKGCVQRP